MIELPLIDDHNLTMGEWYCGAGIGAIGFIRAGYKIKYAFDFNEYAVKTYNTNHGNHAFIQDAKKLDPKTLSEVDVVTGGFPCQPFSVGGSMLGEKDEQKGNLGFYFFNGIKETMPKAFIAENVEGLTNQRNIKFFFKLLEFIDKAGYNVSYNVVDCWEYGVPQTRDRVFIVGIRKDLNKVYSFPDVESKRTTLRDAIADLPKPEDAEQLGIKNHSTYHKGGFSTRDRDKFLQRQWNEPSFTVVSSARHITMHPEPPNYDWRKMTDEQILKNPPPRRFTVRECLRLQTVPDWYYFPEDENLSAASLLAKQYERCSGIPPLVAYKLAKRLTDILTDRLEEKVPTQRKLF